MAARPAPPNEESAKAHVILPLLGLLDWPSYDPSRISFEHAAGSGRIDIALVAGKRPVAFVEAKAPGRQLGNHVDQVLQYAFHEGVDVCALTTGLEWWFYLPREKGKPSDRRFAVLDLRKDSPEVVADGLRRYLGRKALISGSAEKQAKEALANLRAEERLRSEIPKVWKEMRAGPDAELLGLIQGRVQSKIGLDAPATLIANVLGWNAPASGPPRKVKPSSRQLSSESRKLTKSKRHFPRPTSWTLWGSETRVKTWAEVLVGVFAAVHRRHGVSFLETVRPFWGKKKPWISENATTVRRARPIGDSGLYVDTNLSAKSIEQRCRQLLTAFGYQADELEIVRD